MANTTSAPSEDQSLPRLSPDELRPLYQGCWYKPLADTCAILVGIVAVEAVALNWPHPLTWLAAFILIAGLQHHLLILQHESLHFLLLPHRGWNNFLGRLAGYPIGFALAYRRQHLLHHSSLGTHDDPDAWAYERHPKTRARLMLDLLMSVTGFSAFRQFLLQVLGKLSVADDDHVDRQSLAAPRWELIAILLTQAAIFCVFLLSGQWWMYFVMWVLPLATLTKTLTFLRNVAEHVALDANKSPQHARLRTLRCGRIEAFFFAPLNFNYHAEHHIYPGIPYYNLPTAHRLLSQKPAYSRTVDVQDGYLHTILIRAPQVAQLG